MVDGLVNGAFSVPQIKVVNYLIEKNGDESTLSRTILIEPAKY